MLLFYFIYIYSGITFSTIYLTQLTPNLQTMFNIFNISLGLFLSIGSINYQLKDFKTNQNIKNNPNSILFAIFFSSCIIAGIINGNGFERFNNIYFTIHSALFFFLVLTNNRNDKNYLDLINFVIVITLFGIFLISSVTILIYLSNIMGTTELINSKSIKDFFYYSSPIKDRWYTILGNPNTFSHLVSMIFFLTFIPLSKLKNIKHKIFIIIMMVTNIIVLFFAGSKGALLPLFIGLFLFTLYLIDYLIKKKSKVILYILVGILLFTILTFIFLLISNNPTIVKLKYFIENKILRVSSIKEGTGRFDMWGSLLKLPLFTKLWGFPDSYIYNYLKSIDFYNPALFLNNEGRSHNMVLQVLVSFGTISLVLFICCFIKTFVQMIKNQHFIEKDNKFLFIIFSIQFIEILIGGMFEQLPILSLSPHALIFMFVWANLLVLTNKRLY